MASEHTQKTFRQVWDQVAKTRPDGAKRLTFTGRQDLICLYCTGFVDESRYSLRDWMNAFEPHQIKDGSYSLTEEEWMAKMAFHFDGAVGKPFNPMLLREGDWTETNMELLIKQFIIPSVYFTEPEFRSIFDEAKANFYENGVYKVNQKFKEDLKQLIDEYPSPRQVRALGLEDMRAEMAALTSGKKSGFVTGPSRSEQASQKLSELLHKTVR